MGDGARAGWAGGSRGDGRLGTHRRTEHLSQHGRMVRASFLPERKGSYKHRERKLEESSDTGSELEGSLRTHVFRCIEMDRQIEM